jgi:hypothetical protein
MPTAASSMPGRGAKQDHAVAAFAMGYSRRQLFASAAIPASRVGS